MTVIDATEREIGAQRASWAQIACDGVERLLGWLGGALLSVLLALVLVSVALRYFASYSVTGSDEAAIWLYVGLVFFCLPLVSGSSLAMRLDLVPGLLGARGRAVCDVIADAVVVHASLALLAGSHTVIALIGGTAPTLGLPDWLRFLPVAIGAGLSVALVWLRGAATGKKIAATLAVLLGLALWLASQAVVAPVTTPSLVAGGVAFLVLFLGAPLPHALICGLSLAVAFGSPLAEPAIAQNTVAGIGKFMLLAIPFFLLAGVLMNVGGLAQRLVQLAASLVGHRRGGIAQTTLVTNVLFAGISGSSIADAAFGAKVFTPALVAHGYRPERAAAIVAATSVLPNIIPPSVAFLILASVSNLSVGALFLGGLYGGLLLAAFLAVALHFMSDAASRQPPAPGAARLRALTKALPALGLAALILVCIRFGVMTTTEAAALAGLYALAVALSSGRVGTRVVAGAFIQSAREAAAVGLLIGASAPFVFLLAVDDLPSMVQGLFASLGNDPLTVLLIANLMLLVAGCFLDIGAAILLLAPLLLPAASAAGIDPVHFGVVLVVNLMIGGLTPPVGILVYVASRLSGLPATRVFHAVLPLVATLIAGLAVISLYAAACATS